MESSVANSRSVLARGCFVCLHPLLANPLYLASDRQPPRQNPTSPFCPWEFVQAAFLTPDLDRFVLTRSAPNTSYLSVGGVVDMRCVDKNRCKSHSVDQRIGVTQMQSILGYRGLSIGNRLFIDAWIGALVGIDDKSPRYR